MMYAVVRIAVHVVMRIVIGAVACIALHIGIQEVLRIAMHIVMHTMLCIAMHILVHIVRAEICNSTKSHLLILVAKSCRAFHRNA